MTANIILTIITALSLFLAVVAIKVAKNAHDRAESLQYAHSTALEHARAQWSRFSDRIDGIEKGLYAAGGELSTLRQNFDLTMEQKANSSQDNFRLMRKLEALAQHHGLYWDDDGRWSDNPFGASRLGGQVASQGGVASGATIRGAKARSRRA